GYEGVHPEKLSVRDQMLIARSASHVIGVAGSALHIFNLAPNTEASVMVIQRQGTINTEAFTQSLRPYVGSLTTVDNSTGLVGHGLTGPVIPDIEQFLTQCVIFDPN